MPEKIKIKNLLILIILSYIFFIFGNGFVSLSNPDEVFYAQTAKEMLNRNTWMTPYIFDSPQFEKPILGYWLIRIAFLIFGISSFSARFFPALFALIGVIAVYCFGIVGFKNEKKAFICALVVMSSVLYVGLARIVLTDMIFSVFILLSLTAFVWSYFNKGNRNIGLILFYIFSALAVLTKGPLGFIIPIFIVCVFLLIQRDLKFIFNRFSLFGFIIFIIISMPWYIYMINNYGHEFTHEFFYNDHWRRIIEAEHRSHDKWYIYPGYMFLGMFPWSLYVIIAGYNIIKKLKNKYDPMYIFLICWVGIVFLMFQPAHSKLVTYIFPLYPALGIIAGDYLYNIIVSKRKNNLFFAASIMNFCILLLSPVIVFIASTKYPEYIPLKLPVYFIVLIIVMLSILYCFLIFKNQIFKSIFLLAIIFPIGLFVIPFIKSDIEPYIASKYNADYLLKNYEINNYILCSKFYARGIKYYTDKDVAIINIGGRDYFSPHPIVHLNTEEKVRDFLKKQRTTYAVIKKSFIDDIYKIDGSEFKVTNLKIIGTDYIFKIEAI